MRVTADDRSAGRTLDGKMETIAVVVMQKGE